MRCRRLPRRHVNVNVQADDGSTALLWAAHGNDVEMAGALVRAGANESVAVLRKRN